MMKRYRLRKFMAAVLTAIFCVPSVNAFAADGDLLYEDKQVQTITDGVTYEKSSRLYKAGWMDVYVLTIDANNDNVAFDVIQSTQELGLKQSVLQMAEDNGVLAAVNADFFGSGNPFSSMGQVAGDGKMEAVQNYYNGSENKYAGFFIDKDGAAFIDYVKSTMGFYGGSTVAFEMGAKNKITNFSKPVYFDRTVMTTTAQLDSRVKNLTKIVVENGAITKISASGETVTIPENGYIIVMNEATRKSKISYYSVGMKVSFNENNTFVFRPAKQMSDIKVGISGGGELLRNGQVVSQGLIIGQNVRNPRTLIGVNQDKSKIIIMCIDGRTNGIGATHAEAANLMKEYGAYDAIHFDGGGSTTMVAREENQDDLSVVNVPSEGSMRLVANGVGIKSVGTDKELASINIVPADNEDNYLFNGVKTGFYIYGYDGNHNPVEVDKNNITFSSDIEGVWQDNYFTPSQTGTGTITAVCNGVTGTLDVRVLAGANNISVSANTNVLDIGQSTQLKTSCVNADGYQLSASANTITYSVDNEEIGTVENGYFVAKGNGVATVTASVNGYSASTKIAVGKTKQSVYGFENASDKFNMVYYPENEGIKGGAVISSISASQGSSSVRLDYLFADNKTTTQCAYASLVNPVAMPNNTTDFVIDYKGDGSGNLLKAQIKDSANKYYNLEITSAMTDSDWHTAQVALPDGVSQPVTLEKLYVAALSTSGSNVRGTVYVDNLAATVPASSPGTTSSYFVDYMNKNLSQVSEGEDITVFGQTASYSGSDKTSLMSSLLISMANKSKAMLFVGSTSINNTTTVPSVVWNNKYETNGTSQFDIINLATGNGCIRTSSYDQWRWLQGYLSTSQKNNIIINMDKYVWGSGSSALTDSKEAQLLHSILKKYAAETGKNIFVVSATGTSNFVNVKEGVRYINLAGLSSSNKQYLRLRSDGTNTYYQFENVG
jgi:hypothetical protein